MKTLYLKTTMKLLRLLPVLIVFMLALSYNARSQAVVKTPLCYGEPIELLCNYTAGCDNQNATFHWENFSGSWTSSERDPVINVGEVGYATDKFYLSIQFAPPPGGFFGGRVTVTVRAPIIITGTTTPVMCYGTSTGTITINVSGGQIPYQYLWSNGATTQNLTGLSAGSYTVTVTDGLACFNVSSEFVVSESSTPVTVTGLATDASCNGGSNGSIDITPGGGDAPYTFLWSNGAISEDIGGLAAGAYTVTVTDSHGCPTTDSWYVGQPLYPLGVNGEPVNLLCNGDNSGSIIASGYGGTAPYTYLWSDGQITNVAGGLAAGCYTVTVTDAQLCTTTGNYCVTQPDALAATAAVVDVLCNGDCNGTIDMTVTGGTSPFVYVWSNSATTEDVSGLCAGTYFVTITDAHQCVLVKDWTVGAPIVLTVTGVPAEASCYEACDGSINITPAGGTAPFTYLWSNLATTEDVSGLCIGSYSVVVTDAHNCTASGLWTVGSPAALAVTGIAGSASCYSACDGTIDISPIGGTAPYGYVWSDPAGSTTQDVSGLCAGDYFVTITDAHNCTLVDSWTVTQPGEVSWQGSTTNVTCNGLCNGTVTTEFTLGGTPPYTYAWSNGATTADLTGLCAGTYSLTVTDSHSCDARAFRTITEPAVLVVDPIAVITPALCYNGTGGTIDITVTGGTTEYTYLWSNNATTQDIGGLSAGCYTVTVTDANACVATGTFCVGQPDPIVVTDGVTDVSCKGYCDGALDISVTGGTGLYTYLWSNSATTADISGLCEGTYTVVVTDANQCTGTASFTVGSPLELTVTGTGSSASCFGSCDGSVDITPAGGTAPYTYIWSDPAGSTTQDIVGTLCPGDYNVTVTDAHNCTATGMWTVTEPGEVSWQGSTTNVSCNGVCDGTISTEFTLGGTPPYTYAWSNGATTADLTGLCAGTYSVTITDSHSCDARSFRTITQPDVLVIDPVAVITPATCYGGSGGSIEITVTGGTLPYSFLWSNNAVTQNISGLSAGCYTVTVTDANNCMDTETFCVGQPDPIAAVGIATDVLCLGDCNGMITLTSVTGGTPPYSFSWSNFATTQDITGLCEGTYTVSIMDAHECTFTGTWHVGAPAELTVQGVPANTLCFGDCNGYINITPAGGTAPYTYVWNDPAISTTQNVTGLCAGDYSVTVTDAHNCNVVGIWTVGEPGEVSWQGSTTNVTCFGACNGTITTEFTMGGTPPYTYAWSNGATTADLTGLCAGTYSVTITDSHSCDARSFRTITEPAVLAVDPIAVITPALCYGGSGGAIDITVTGGTLEYTYLWSNTATTQDIYDLTAGCYTVTVTDGNACVATGSFCVGQPDAINATGHVVDALCKGDCNGMIHLMNITGGTSPYAFAWSNGATTQDISGLCEGTYAVTITDAHSCDFTGSWTVGAPDVLAVTGQATNSLCYGDCNGYINIIPTGGTTPYTYVWSDPAGSTTQNVTGLCAGDYFVTVTDAHNCTVVDSWTVGQPGEVSWQGSTTNVSCNGVCDGTITTEFTIGGTPPYTYAWSNGATTADLTGLCAGTYSVTITDSHSCDARSFRTITQPDVLVIDPVAVITPATCYGGSGGAIEITVTGGTLPYSFLWSNNATTQNISGLAAGCYTVTVTDANNCMDTETFCVGQPDPIAAIGIVTDALCKGDCNGMITLTSVTGGTPPYSFAWSNFATTQDISGLCEGTYTVLILDSHECTFTGSWTVGAPDVLAVTGQATNSLCFGDCNGFINITPTGGTTPYTYVWSDPAGSTTQNVTGLCAGDYFVTVTDAHNCTVVDSWTVGQPGEVSWQGSTTNVTCFGACNGTITTEFTIGGTPPYTYAWSNGATTADLTGLCAGTYSVTITDSHSCDARSFRTITEPAVLAVDPSALITNVSCYSFSNGAIDITVTGGTEPYAYLWSNNATTQDISGLIAGCYTVTVTDYQNCMTTASFCVTQPDLLTVVGSVTDALCYGDCNGSITQTVNGGTLPYAFAWSNLATTQNLTGLCVGTYYVTITDAQSCEVFGTYTISQPDELIIGQPVVTMVTCNGASNGSINGGMVPGTPPTILPIPVTGGTLPYTYLWSNGITTDNLCCLVAGCYTVTVTDAHGCQDIGSWCITEPPALSLDAVVTNVACFAGTTGAIDLTVTGGTLPYQSYTWSNSATTEDISGLTAGVYSVTVEDINGCLITGSWEILQPTQLVVTLVDITDVSCFGLADGGIEITVTGGTTPYSFEWSNAETTQNISGLTAGCYTVTVTDANGCTTTGSWCVTEPDALALQASITSVDCYSFSTGAIDLTVTGGTLAYNYVWSNGATTEDISGLLAGFYTVTVTDAHSCEISGTYEILEPPMWSVGLTGPTTACCNDAGVVDYYANVGGFLGTIPGTTMPCTPADITYEWVVVGGTITSGWNTGHITVDWECCTVGTVTVTATKCDGCYLSTTLTVAVSLPPAPVVTGPATVYSNGTDTYCALPYIPGHLYSWTVINGSYTTIPGTNCITVTWNSYPACGCAMVIVCETDPITGCTGCDTLYITMLPNPADISIQGTVSYKNGLPNTPLNGVTIKLRDLTSGLIIGTTVSGPNMNPPLYTGDPGYYAFTNVPAGNYRLESSYNGTWGGNNATDALLVQLQAGLEFGPPSNWILQGLYHTVGDVNASGFVTALDALYIKLRTVGSINSYPAGDWKFEEPAGFTLPAVVDFAGLCVGDVNGSFIPTGFKEVSFLSVVDNETQIVPVDQTFAYEIRSNMVANLGAMTLFMGYDTDRFEVIDVTASSNDEMKYVIEDGNVAIAWADTKPMSVRNDDQLFTLTVKSKAPITEATQIFNVKTGSEFASPTGSRYDNFDLKMSKVITSGGSNEFSIFNYPNPFANNTKIVYTLPEAGKVTLVITDMFGKTIRTLVDESQAAGTYSIPVNATEINMTSGVYLYRIEAVGATDTYVKVNKMIFAR
jgi:uncharacterized protein (UPF0333 family)